MSKITSTVSSSNTSISSEKCTFDTKGYDFTLYIKENNSAEFWYKVFIQIPSAGVLIFINLSIFLVIEEDRVGLQNH